jgi:hypothetical protein
MSRNTYAKTEFICLDFHVANNVILKNNHFALSGESYCGQLHLISSHRYSIDLGWCIVLSVSVTFLYSRIETGRRVPAGRAAAKIVA